MAGRTFGPGWLAGSLPGTAAVHDAQTGFFWDDRVMRLRVLIVDDHPEFRAAAAELLEEEGFAVVGGAPDAGRRSRRRDACVRMSFCSTSSCRARTVSLSQSCSLRCPTRRRSFSSRAGTRRRTARAWQRRRRDGFIAKRELSGAALAALVA